MNEDRTCDDADTPLTQPRPLSVPEIRRELNAMRALQGPKTAIGHHCSNILELLKNHTKATGKLKADLHAAMLLQMAGLRKHHAA